MPVIMTFIGEIVEFILNHPILVTVVFLVCALGYVGYVLYTQIPGLRPNGPNPFATNSARPVRPLVTDPSARDKVLKQAFKVKDIPDNLDAIVVGSGMGGLTIAAILAKADKKVLVLEQHDQAGGCLHTFVDKGFEFDVGIHYIGEMTTDTVTRELVNQLTDGQLQWVNLEKDFDVVAIGRPGKQKMYPVMTGRENYRKALLEQFPQEKEAIDKFIGLLQEVARSEETSVLLKLLPKWLVSPLIKLGIVDRMTNYFSYVRKSLKETLDELTDNDELKAVMSYNFGDYGVAPGEAGFATQAGLINHFKNGASYPLGGSSEFAFHMIPVIERSGGKVLVRAPVSQILIDGGRACGVRVQKTSGDIDIHAPLVISDAGAMNTFRKLLPKEVAENTSIFKMLDKKVKSGIGAMSVFVGLKGTKEELGLRAQNVWAFTGNNLDDLVQNYMSLTKEEAMEADVPLIFSSFPSAKDPTFNDRFPGKSTCTLVTLAPWEWFADWQDKRVMKRGEDYENLKNTIAKKMWEQTVTMYPHLKDKVEFFEAGSPVSNNYYIASTKGEIYGLDHNRDRFGSPEVAMTLRPQTDIPGLMLTGQDILSGGFVGALYAGLVCACAALNRDVLTDLVKLKKTIAKDK